jgi:ABC-2 type transport system permease protein
MSAALAITRVTTRQVLGLKRVLGFGALTLMPSFVFFVSSGTQSASRRFETFLGIGLGFFFALIVPTVTLIFSAAALGEERREQTLSFLVLRPISRFTIAGSKLLAAFLGAFALTGPGAFVLGALYGTRSGDWSYVVPMVAAAAVATGLYASIFLILGYITERSTIVGLAYLFIWENGIVFAVPALATTSPWRLGYATFLGLAPPAAFDQIGEALGTLSPGAGESIVRGLVFLVASTLIMGWLLRRRDIT